MSTFSEIDMIVTDAMDCIEMGYYVKDAMAIVQEHYNMQPEIYDYVYQQVSTQVYGNTA